MATSLPKREANAPDLSEATLLKLFHYHFDALPANTLDRLRIAQRIRHQVYCVECSHEASSDPDGLERDQFDTHAPHSVLIHRATNVALGTVRLILPLPGKLERSFSVQRVLDPASLRALNKLPLHSMGEVSRFSISRQFRRVAETSGSQKDAAFMSNAGPLMRLGLMQALLRMSNQHGITHWCAAVEPTFQRLFAAMGIRFTPIGPWVEYHGLRQPCYGVIEDVLNTVQRERPAYWSVLTDGGTLAD